MKKIFSLSFRSVSRHMGMSILIMLQIIILFIGMNTLIASRNQQKMLIQPYSDLLDKEGYYLSYKVTPTFGKDEINLIESLNGEWETTMVSKYSFANSNIMVYPDDFWDSYDPSIKHGKKPKSSKTSDSPWCIATANYNDKTIEVPGFNKSIKVKGVLADKCYIPSMNTWDRKGSIKENLYDTFNLSQSDTVYILMPQSQWDEFSKGKANLIKDSNCIAVLKSELTEEQIAENEKLLRIQLIRRLNCRH